MLTLHVPTRRRPKGNYYKNVTRLQQIWAARWRNTKALSITPRQHKRELRRKSTVFWVRESGFICRQFYHWSFSFRSLSLRFSCILFYHRPTAEMNKCLSVTFLLTSEGIWELRNVVCCTHTHILSQKMFVLPHLFYFYTFYSFNFFLSLMTLFCYYFRVESRKKVSRIHMFMLGMCVSVRAKEKGKSIFPIKLCVCNGAVFLV